VWFFILILCNHIRLLWCIFSGVSWSLYICLNVSWRIWSSSLSNLCCIFVIGLTAVVEGWRFDFQTWPTLAEQITHCLFWRTDCSQSWSHALINRWGTIWDSVTLQWDNSGSGSAWSSRQAGHCRSLSAGQVSLVSGHSLFAMDDHSRFFQISN